MGRSNAVVKRLTTSIECTDISMFIKTRTYLQSEQTLPLCRRYLATKTISTTYSDIWLELISFRSSSNAIIGLFSTSKGNLKATRLRVSNKYSARERDKHLPCLASSLYDGQDLDRQAMRSTVDFAGHSVGL